MSRRRFWLLASGIFLAVTLQTAAQKSLTFKVGVRLSPEWFKPTALTPEEVSRGAVPMPEVTTDFFGNPRDPNRPSMGAIEFSGATTAPAIEHFGQTEADETGHGIRGSNMLKASLFRNTVASGLLTEIAIHVFQANPGCRLRIGIWQFTGSFSQPGSLLFDAGELSSPTAGWNSIKGLEFPVTRDEWYWIGWNNTSDLDVYHSNTEGFSYSYLAYSGGLPSTFPSANEASVNTSLRAKVSRPLAPSMLDMMINKMRAQR